MPLISFKKPLEFIKKNILLSLSSMLLTLFFFLTSFSVWIVMQLRLIEYLKVLVDILNENAPMIAEAIMAKESLLGLMTRQAEFSLYYTKSLQLVLFFVVIAYCLCVLFEGNSWFLLEKKKRHYWNYMGKFALVSLITILLSCLFVYGFISWSYNDSISGLFGQKIINFVFAVLFLLLVYVSLVGYSLLGKYGLRKLFKKIFINFKKRDVFYSYVACVVIFLVAFVIVSLLSRLSYFGGVLVGIILFMPIIVYSKVLIQEKVK